MTECINRYPLYAYIHIFMCVYVYCNCAVVRDLLPLLPEGQQTVDHLNETVSIVLSVAAAG
jgi:hypothetical protein